LERKIYEELIAQDDPDTKMFDFPNFLYNNHSESNWFLAALRAAQPYLCENPDRKVKDPPSPEKQREFWEMAREAAEDLAKEGLKAAVEPVAHILCEVVPFLAGASSAFTFGFSFLLVHYAKKGYCSAKIQTEIIQTLKWHNDENR
jgi:hypothetical protein